jgi:2-polyprenyl-3-methyl-5-hydroxy-6-metoxy-1,4-benzoquinol methylase
MYLTKQQIESIVKKVGQPRASILLHKIFNSYRACLDSSDFKELYDRDYFEGIRATPVYELVDNRYKIHIYNRYSYKYLLRKWGRGSVLDIGCGDGHFLLALAFQGFKCTGIDSSEDLIREAQINAIQNKLKVDFFCEDGCNLSLRSPFDYIVLNDVIEHLSDRELQKLFNNIRDLLNPKGEIIIHTPNGLALCNGTDWSILELIYKNYLRVYRRFNGYERAIHQIFYDQVHINIKSYRQLKKFLSRVGFRSKVIYDDYNNSILRSVLSTNMLVTAWMR